MKGLIRVVLSMLTVVAAGSACAGSGEAFHVGKPVEVTLIASQSLDNGICETHCIEFIEIRGIGRFLAVRGPTGKYEYLSQLEKGRIRDTAGVPLPLLDITLSARVEAVADGRQVCTRHCGFMLGIENRGDVLIDLLPNGRVAALAPLDGEAVSIYEPSHQMQALDDEEVPYCRTGDERRSCRAETGGLTGSPGNITGSMRVVVYYDRNGFIYKIEIWENGKKRTIDYRSER